MLIVCVYIEVYSCDNTIGYQYNDTIVYLPTHVLRYRSMCVHNGEVAYSLLIVYPVYRDELYTYNISWGMMPPYMYVVCTG